MIVGLGLDISEIDRVAAVMARHPTAFVERVFTPAEAEYCRKFRNAAERFAGRFAAKEANLKVLRPVDEAIPWRTIEVVRHGAGWVEVELSGRAAALAAEAGLSDFALSISHEAGYASAIVIAELDLRNRRSDPIEKT